MADLAREHGISEATIYTWKSNLPNAYNRPYASESLGGGHRSLQVNLRQRAGRSKNSDPTTGRAVPEKIFSVCSHILPWNLPL
jgi:transposase-like protein